MKSHINGYEQILILLSIFSLFAVYSSSFNLSNRPTAKKKYFITDNGRRTNIDAKTDKRNTHPISASTLASPPRQDEGTQNQEKTPLSMAIDQLGTKLNGRGRALTAWDCYKVGLDPIYFFSDCSPEVWDHNVYDAIKTASFGFGDDDDNDTIKKSVDSDDVDNDCDYRERLIRKYMPMKRKDIHSKQEGKGMGTKALNRLSNLYKNSLGIEYSVASLVNLQRSSDGTVKMLLKLNKTQNVAPEKDFFIESVIIPWYDRSNPTSTLCVSTQVGCNQGCTFCATGKMGLLKRLSTDEILIQLYYAKKICRILNGFNAGGKDSRDNKEDVNYENTRENNNKEWLPDIDNIVFMGMGDSGDNADAVIDACSIMADRQCFAIPQNKITISTVGPDPQVFQTLGQADAVLAWSVHAVDDTLRKKLVPTTKYTMKELRDGLIQALNKRSKRMRALMIEVTLIDDVNDGIKEAEEMAVFCLEMMNRVNGMKLIVNLIPFNDIGHRSYRKSRELNILAYQRVLIDSGVKSYVRTTRGDDENAACGQLATKKVKGNHR